LILVDTSVWIDFLSGAPSEHRFVLRRFIEEEEDIAIADVILMEILQGIKSNKDFVQVKDYLLTLPSYNLKNTSSYIEAAQIYRTCRKKGLTIRRSLDCLIARIAIENNLLLFHNDRDFDLIAKVFKDLQILRL